MNQDVTMLMKSAIVVFAVVFSNAHSSLSLPLKEPASALIAVVDDVSGSSEKPASIAMPPMGWSSWNTFSNSVDTNVVIEQAKALLSSGMAQAGYRYVNIDEGWWLGERDQNGNIVVNPTQWPALKQGEHDGDMSNIVRYIHESGLKAGIYTDGGESGCGFYGPDLGPPMPHTGSEGHYEQDFLQFAQWGFDYVKVDWCGGHKEDLDPAVQYAAVARAIERAERLTHHHLYFSICNWGNGSSWTWAPGVGGITSDIWRTSGDIVAPIVANGPNRDRKATFAGVLSNFDLGIHPTAQHTGYYNDPDMMVIGMPGLTENQNKAHMALWAISGAPLIVGADLAKLDIATKAALTNRGVIAIDQDSLGLQAVKVAERRLGLQVWAKPLAATGEHAVLLLNRTAVSSKIEINWAEIGLDPSSEASVRDVWSDKLLGPYRQSYTATVPAGDALLFVVRGVDSKATQYNTSSPSTEPDGGSIKDPCQGCSTESPAFFSAQKTVTFKIAALRGPEFIRISYMNRDDHSVMGELSIDGQLPTRIVFPPTPGGHTSFIAVEVESKRIEGESILSVSAPFHHEGSAITSLSVLAGGHE